MNQRNDEDWLDETIARATDIGKVEFDRAKWLDKLAAGSQEPDASTPPVLDTKCKPPKTIWRAIMENRVTRYSAAAAVVMATTFVLFGPSWAPGNGGVVLADVQQKVAAVETMIIRGTKTFTYPGQDGDVFEFDGFKGEFDLVKYVSKQHGFVEEGYDGDQLVYRMTFNRPERKTLIVLPPWKKYIAFPSTDKQMQLLANLTPEGIVNLLVDGDSKVLRRDRIDGVEAEVFGFQNREPFKGLLPKPVFDLKDYTGKIWIGVEEQMPLRIEGDLIMGKSFMTMFHELNLREVNTLADYNVELDDAIFDTAPPEDCTELTLSDLLQVMPAKAKAAAAGLGIVPAGLVFWIRRRRRAPVHPG